MGKFLCWCPSKSDFVPHSLSCLFPSSDWPSSFSDRFTTGAKFSKEGAGHDGTLGALDGHQSLLNYLARVFFIRNLVSKKRRRLVVAGYDLDMSYITDRLLAMSFPAEHMRAMYRNPLWQVKSVLDMRHEGHYKVYNLCAEQNYDVSHFHGRVEVYPFDDNHVPPLSLIKLFCESVHAWLSRDPQNVAVIHCMAGKGRTGLMVCSYLVFTGMSADNALQLYADRRTTNNEGVSIPSQRRYVRYWSEILSFPRGLNTTPDVNVPQPQSRELRRIRLYDTLDINSVFFVVSELQENPGQAYQPPVELTRKYCRQMKQGQHHTSSPRYYLSFVKKEGDEKVKEQEVPRFVVQMDTESSDPYKKTCLDYYFDCPLQVAGDVRVVFYEKTIGGRLFYACFHTAFITSSLLQFSRRDLDKVGRKGRSICGPTFCLELLFGPANSKHPNFPLHEASNLLSDSFHEKEALHCSR